MPAEDSGIFFCQVYNDDNLGQLGHLLFFCNRNKKLKGGSVADFPVI